MPKSHCLAQTKTTHRAAYVGKTRSASLKHASQLVRGNGAFYNYDLDTFGVIENALPSPVGGNRDEEGTLTGKNAIRKKKNVAGGDADAKREKVR